MSQTKHHPTLRESIISIALVAVALIILIFIFTGQCRTNISRFGITQPVTEKSPGPPANDLAQLAPQGFKPFGPAESYNSETLYEKINGKAPLYTESGFVKLSTQRYINEKDENLTFELYLYDMGKIKNAFSVYSIQRRPASSGIEEMTFAYRTENALYLAYGKYYCELIGSSDSPLLLDAMDLLATTIIENLKDAGPKEISELEFFPANKIVSNSFILYLNGAFGFDGLTNTFSAKYNYDNQIVTAFISIQSDTAAAGKLLDSYYQFLIDNGGTEIASPDSTAKYVDFYGSLEVISATGRFIFGIHQAEDRSAAEIILALIRNNLLAAAKSSMVLKDAAGTKEKP